MFLRKNDMIPFLRYSPRRIEIDNENGIEIMMAKNEVINVPRINGRQPYWEDRGSQ